ncbi:MAG TPA: hypothetical protein VKT82_06930 [Ktedonobacterales bacterium]|nr:hypothetical protein [Ktedonobacterales bacterium]
MSENPQQKQRNWRGPIIGSALGIPGVGALIVTIVTIVFLHNAGAVHLAWSSAGAIALSLLISFVLLFIVFVLGIVFALRVFFKIMKDLLDDLFQSVPKPEHPSVTHPVDKFLLNMMHSMILPNTAQPASSDIKETIVDAVSQYAKGQEPPASNA